GSLIPFYLFKPWKASGGVQDRYTACLTGRSDDGNQAGFLKLPQARGGGESRKPQVGPFRRSEIELHLPSSSPANQEPEG
ncbi:MAG TPA: hypothetical protein VFT74_04775, partial [Isosphaeraceae bacterium]|nr:hypothetical protein [Isosphaeraceae bacterium]